MAESVDERILTMQARKKQTINAAIGGGGAHPKYDETDELYERLLELAEECDIGGDKRGEGDGSNRDDGCGNDSSESESESESGSGSGSESEFEGEGETESSSESDGESDDDDEDGTYEED